MLPWQLIKFSHLDKIHMNHRGLLKKHFCRNKNVNICSETAKIATFHFSHCKSMETISCRSNQSSSQIRTKKHNYPFLHLHMLYVKYGKNQLQRRSQLKMLTDGRRMPAYTIGSGELKNSCPLILYKYIAPGHGQTAPRGQSFDVNRNVLSLHLQV